MYIVCKISAFQVHMQLGCVDTANGYGVCKKCIAFITRNPLDISACFKLPFLLYIYCTLVTMRLHTGWNHSPTKAQTTPETFHTVYRSKNEEQEWVLIKRMEKGPLSIWMHSGRCYFLAQCVVCHSCFLLSFINSLNSFWVLLILS